MAFHFGPKSTLLLFFFIHGILFSALLLVRALRDESRSSRWLSLFIFLCSLYIAPFMLGYADWYALDGYREVLFYLPLQQVLLIGPVIYFSSLLHLAYGLSACRTHQFVIQRLCRGASAHVLYAYLRPVRAAGERKSGAGPARSGELEGPSRTIDA